MTPGPPRRVNLDNNVSQTRSGSTYYYMKDGLGSIRNLVDSSEATQNTYDYYAFGKELGTWTQNVTNRYTYTAREYDAEAKQYYYRARYYAGQGWFLSRDPLTPYGYLYVRNSPCGAVDAMGLTPQVSRCACSYTLNAPNEWLTMLTSVFVLHGSDGSQGTSIDFVVAMNIWAQCCIIPDDSSGVTTVSKTQTEKALGGDTIFNVINSSEWQGLIALGAQKKVANVFFVERFGRMDGAGVHDFVRGLSIAAVANGRAADTLAHELGHHLGLGEHRDPSNLMYNKGRTNNFLTKNQCESARSFGLANGSLTRG